MRRRTACSYLALAIAAVGLLAQAGCAPRNYRTRADNEVYELVDCTAADPRWSLPGFTIDIDPRSRMYDPSCPDRPAMPPDDPTSHRYMHCVDCKAGSPCWRCGPKTQIVENPLWLAYLPRNEEGKVVLDLDASVQTALLDSRDYQDQLENLYLAALDVTAEEFLFDTQFFGGTDVSYTAQGPLRSGRTAGSSVLDVSPFSPANRLRAEKLFAGGGTLVVGLANSLIWEFSGPDENSALTVLDFGLVQPLLRNSGRAVVLESLTQAQRNLLAGVRQMERFRRAFYVDIAAGRSAGRGPLRGGGYLGDTGLQILGGAGGYYGLLQDAQLIRNQIANVEALRESVAQLQASHEAGRIDRFQVDLARQALYNAQSRLVTIQTNYETSLDQFKFQLGLPPNLDVEIVGDQLDQFQLLDPTLSQIDAELRLLLETVRTDQEEIDAERLGTIVDQGLALRQRVVAHLAVVRGDLERLEAALPERRESLERLLGRDEVTSGEVEQTVFEADRLNDRVVQLRRDVGRLTQEFQVAWNQVGEDDNGQPVLQPVATAAVLNQLLTRLSDRVLEMQLVQARIRLDTVVIPEIELTSEQAFEVALVNRRDLMNARAALVDAWRQIAIATNDLQSGLDVVVNGDIRNVGDNPVNLQATNGSLRVGLEFDAPLTRLLERNFYRETLINYQRARRDFYAQIDRVDQGLRATLRVILLNELNFELRREATRVAISQVDLARLRLQRPPQPGETSEFGATTARDLVNALSDLLNVQNDFLGVWVNYEVQRMVLDLDLGTMQLDDRGMWIDPGESIGRNFGPGMAALLEEGCLPPLLLERLIDEAEQDTANQPDENIAEEVPPGEASAEPTPQPQPGAGRLFAPPGPPVVPGGPTPQQPLPEFPSPQQPRPQQPSRPQPPQEVVPPLDTQPLPEALRPRLLLRQQDVPAETNPADALPAAELPEEAPFENAPADNPRVPDESRRPAKAPGALPTIFGPAPLNEPAGQATEPGTPDPAGNLPLEQPQPSPTAAPELAPPVPADAVPADAGPAGNPFRDDAIELPPRPAAEPTTRREPGRLILPIVRTAPADPASGELPPIPELAADQ